MSAIDSAASRHNRGRLLVRSLPLARDGGTIEPIDGAPPGRAASVIWLGRGLVQGNPAFYMSNTVRLAPFSPDRRWQPPQSAALKSR